MADFHQQFFSYLLQHCNALIQHKNSLIRRNYVLIRCNNAQHLFVYNVYFSDGSDTWFAGKSNRLHTRSYSESATPTYNLGHPIGGRVKTKKDNTDERDDRLRIRPKSALGSTTPNLSARSLNYSMLGHTRPMSGKLSASFDKETGRASVLGRSFGGGEDIPFISTPSIPKSHMPHPSLMKQEVVGWGLTHRPREWTL